MGMEITTRFISKSTVWIQAKVYDPVTNELTDPTNEDNPITLEIADHDGVKKVGYISVASNLGFTIGDTVIGGTSGATGYVKSIPAGELTLELQRVTGVWQTGEALIAEDEETTTTTSVLLGAAMTKHGEETGTYDYFYDTVVGSPVNWWHGEVTTLDGTGEGIRTTIVPFGFEVQKGIS